MAIRFMKIGIIGNYGATNIGDDAILSSIIQSHPHNEFVIFSANPSLTELEYGYKSVAVFPLGFRSFFRHGFKNSIKAIKSVDVVILGGGGLMQDAYLYACFLWAWQVFWVRIFKKPYFIYANGLGPLKTKIGQWLTRYVFSKAAQITVRDQCSLDLLKKLKISSKKISQTADPVFLSFNKLSKSKSGHMAHYLISLRPWLKKDQAVIEELTRFLLYLKNNKKARFTFVVMQKINEADQILINILKERVGGLCVFPQNHEKLIKLMDSAEFAIGMRFHFLLAALITQTPFIGIGYSPKVKSLFLHPNFQDYYLDLDELTANSLKEKLIQLSLNYNNVQRFQKKESERFYQLAKQNQLIFDDYLKKLTNSN